MQITELFKTHKKNILKSSEIKSLFGGVDTFKNYGVFDIAPTPNEMYLITAKTSKAFSVNSNQKYRHIINNFSDQIKPMPHDIEEKIIDNLFDTCLKMGLINNSKNEINFIKNDIILSNQFVENDVYQLKLKTSGKSYHNKPLRMYKYFYLNNNEFTIINSLVFEIQRRTFTIAYHIKGDKIVVFTTVPYNNIKTILKNEFDINITDASNFINNYIRKIIFDICWKSELIDFFSNKDYNYENFEQEHLDLYFSFII